MTGNLPRQTLEALVRGDMEAYQSLVTRLSPQDDQHARSLIYSALVAQANAKWTETTDVGEIRRWVASLRNEAEQQLGDINPVSCEKIIVGVITGDPDKMAGVAQAEITNLVALLTFKLAHEAELEEPNVQELANLAEELTA